MPVAIRVLYNLFSIYYFH